MRTTVESKKLQLIQDFLKIQNEKIINKIEALIKKERFKALEGELDTPFSENEFNEMIDRSENDAIQGKLHTSKELKKQIHSWK
jgi:hypothetical protein